ncbi:YchJ family protein [Arcobacter vandammei]|uniref:YchJ family protein n=1 Tax=Arcobacter vandammei TaxID=2782243 RepID=UPI0018DF750B|nr:YchJ family metal-binding protein [Arcobacter vandammei]
MKFNSNSLCPCGSLIKYKKCCKIFHENIAKPKTALELMQSRYCAFALNLSEYIIKTTHKENQDYTNDILNWKQDIENFSINTEFRNLEILDFQEDSFESFVTFKATLFQGNQDISFIEKSRFLKENEIWLYVDGKFL